jgi:2'-5' RNA ligase
MIGESRRIFFALWPDNGVRSRLEQLAAMLPPGRGRAHAAEDLHLTLAFIGQAGRNIMIACAWPPRALN